MESIMRKYARRMLNHKLYGTITVNDGEPHNPLKWHDELMALQGKDATCVCECHGIMASDPTGLLSIPDDPSNQTVWFCLSASFYEMVPVRASEIIDPGYFYCPYIPVTSTLSINPSIFVAKYRYQKRDRLPSFQWAYNGEKLMRVKNGSYTADEQPRVTEYEVPPHLRHFQYLWDEAVQKWIGSVFNGQEQP